MNDLKKFVSIILMFSILVSIIPTAYAEDDVVEYVPDEKLTLTSAQIRNLIGKDQKINFKIPDINYDTPLECELFPGDSPKPEDIEQGASGICYLLAALSSIAQWHPEIIKQAMKDNGDGTVTVKLYDLITAKPRFIKVQKTIPDLPRSCMLLKKECLWVELMIKAMIAVNLEQRACIRSQMQMNYGNIEGGLAEPVLKMVTGKECIRYNDFDLYKKGEQEVYNIIKDTIENGSGIITCDFNHNRFKAVLRPFLRLPPSDKGLVYRHEYSIVDAFEDENNEKWVVVRNPWGVFNTTYDEQGNRIVQIDDRDSLGYAYIRLKDFYECCGSLSVLSNNDLKAMTRGQLIREKSRSGEFIVGVSLGMYLLVLNFMFKDIKNKNFMKVFLINHSLKMVTLFSLILTLIVW